MAAENDQIITKKTISVFIAASMDNFIADKNGNLDWLHSIPNPNNIDMGYNEFIQRIDAIVMGRTTFETVCSFDIEWPYPCPVYVLSNTLKHIPKPYDKKATLVNGDLTEIIEKIHTDGFNRLYIDGGTTVQNFLKEDLIDELIITTIPVLLGAGSPLFSNLEHPLEFKCINTALYIDSVVQNHFIRAPN